MKKLLLVILATVVVIAGVRVYQTWASQQNTQTDVSGQIVTVSRGSIAATVNAVGVIQPKREMALTFKNAGRVQDVLVEKGEAVSRGQVLATLEEDDLERQVQQAEIGLRIAQERLALTKGTPKAEDLAAAEAALQAARENLARLQEGPSESQLVAAKASLDAAQERYDRLLATPSEQDLRRARLAIDQAKNSLWGAQNARDSAGFSVQLGGPRAQLDQAEAQVLNAEIAVTLAEMNYQELRKGPSQADVATALASLEQARDAYESLKTLPRQSELAAARSQVVQAEASLARLRGGASPEEVAIAQAQVDQARLSLEQARSLLDGAALTAPYDGVVASVQIKEGALASAATPAMLLVDVSEFAIEVNVDEIDIVNIEAGQPVVLVLDALINESIPGSVASIAPVASSVGGIVSYAVEIGVGATDLPLRAGMSANAEITTLRKENVLLVPNRAIRIDRSNGTYHVETWRNGTITDVQIVPGMRNETHSEVLSGLAEGTDLIIRSQTFGERVSNSLFGG